MLVNLLSKPILLQVSKEIIEVNIELDKVYSLRQSISRNTNSFADAAPRPTLASYLYDLYRGSPLGLAEWVKDV